MGDAKLLFGNMLMYCIAVSDQDVRNVSFLGQFRPKLMIHVAPRRFSNFHGGAEGQLCGTFRGDFSDGDRPTLVRGGSCGGTSVGEEAEDYD